MGGSHFHPGPTEIIPYKLALKFISNPIPVLTDIVNKYGDISHFKFGPTLHVYLVNSPYHIEHPADFGLTYFSIKICDY